MSQKADALVSLIIPVYNAEDYLPLCIESALRQSYRHLEVILIDDGSTDSSPAICDRYASMDARIKVIHQANGGIAQAQNAGLDAARGTYIAFADNDDILDSHNVELLMLALVRTGADMSKARWRHFGPSEIQKIRDEAKSGANEPSEIVVFSNPLAAYQKVFCKSLRILGDLIGRHSEALYFNEANWCRLYRADLWKDIRFPVGRYAQDTAVAGKLYTRMNKVADINVTLYNWLQRSDSVTHKPQQSIFYHDHIEAALENMSICHRNGITPARSYYTLMGNLHYEHLSVIREHSTEAKEQLVQDQKEAIKALRVLTCTQRICCQILSTIRLIEKAVYDRKIKNIS